MPVRRPAADLGALYAWALSRPRSVSRPDRRRQAVFAGLLELPRQHGAGGVGRQLDNGEVSKTFPDARGQLRSSTRAARRTPGKVYGDPNRAGGAHRGGSFNGSFMPQQGEKYGRRPDRRRDLAVVCHERYDIGGAEPLDQRSTAGVRRTGAPPERAEVRRASSTRATTTLGQEGIARRPSESGAADAPAGALRRPRRRRRPAGGAAATGWRATATTSPSSSASRSPARRRAVTA
jgi:hypothetical protein